MLIDSHCHLASHRFSREEIPALIANARAAGVSHLVTLATGLGDLQANLDFANDPHVHACIGIHPCDVHSEPDDAVASLAAHVDDPRVCAIGETGLDYYHPEPDGWAEHAFRARQKDFLRQHFELAAKAGLNIVIHTRDKTGQASFDDALAIYRDYHRTVRAQFHCFISSMENAESVIKLGGILSFGGVTTFKNATLARDTSMQSPAGTWTLETDSPYLAPTPHRGQRNEPAFTRHTADFLAATRGETLDQLAAHTTATARAFFRFREDSFE